MTLPEPTHSGSDADHREVRLRRLELGRYQVANPRGGTIRIGAGDTEDFSAVELLLAAIAGCSSVDVDHLTSRRSDPTEFAVTATGRKVRDDRGNHLDDLIVSFRLRFPEGADGDAARARIGAALTASHERLCSVSRTISLGTPVTMQEDTP